jgi:hypothetical protein
MVKTWLYVSALRISSSGPGELQPDEEGVDTADDEEDQTGGAVHDADLLVVDREEPAAPTGVALRAREHPQRALGMLFDLSRFELERFAFDDRHQVLLGITASMDVAGMGLQRRTAGVSWRPTEESIGQSRISR